MRKILIFTLATLSAGLFAQKNAPIDPQSLNGSELNRLNYAVPFLTISTDSRAAAMGDAGVATAPDVYSLRWNPAKYAFSKNDMEVAVSYIPWLRALVNDINIGFLTAYYRLDNKQVISGSLTYFSLGEITFRKGPNEVTGQYKPNEFAIDMAYSRLLSDNFSGGIAFRYIRSDLSRGYFDDTHGESKAGNSFAADVAFYYTNNIKIADYKSKMSFGVNISNLGTKITYTDETNKQFLPTNLRLGGNLAMEYDEFNEFNVSLDFNKFLIPTPPVRDSKTGEVIDGKNDKVSVAEGVFQSFWDAPGTNNTSTFSEELSEIMTSIGVEYWYAKQFAVRAGYFHESEKKGGRKLFTLGAGVQLSSIGIDFSYTIPQTQNHPLANSLRFSISYKIGQEN